MTGKLHTCHTCKEICWSQSTYKYHVKRVHRDSVTVTFAGDTVKIISRGADGKFKCFCSRSFLLSRSLCEHAKGCNWEASCMTGSTIASVTSGELSESSMTEGEEGEETVRRRVTADLPFDCIGELVHENGLKCR
jgi:hypothetical protein